MCKTANICPKNRNVSQLDQARLPNFFLQNETQENNSAAFALACGAHCLDGISTITLPQLRCSSPLNLVTRERNNRLLILKITVLN